MDKCDGAIVERAHNYVCRDGSTTTWDGTVQFDKFLPGDHLEVAYELHGVTSRLTLEPITEEEYEALIHGLNSRSSDFEAAGHDSDDSKGYLRLPFEAVEQAVSD